MSAEPGVLDRLFGMIGTESWYSPSESYPARGRNPRSGGSWPNASAPPAPRTAG